MATLRREWVSVEQAQQWIDTYDPKWMSTQVKDAMAKEISSGKKLRWWHAIIIDQDTNICHDGYTQLLAIVKGSAGPCAGLPGPTISTSLKASLSAHHRGIR